MAIAATVTNSRALAGIWWLKSNDAWIVSSVIGLYPHKLNNFPALPARLKQGMLNTLVLAHLMKQGQLNSLPGFQTAPSVGVFHGPSQEEFYVGASLGGIMGLYLAALTPSIERFNIDVGAMNFAAAGGSLPSASTRRISRIVAPFSGVFMYW